LCFNFNLRRYTADRHRRRAGVSAWLRKQVARSRPPAASLRGRTAEGTHVAAGRSVRAAAAAVAARDPRLATLMAQCNTGGNGGRLAAGAYTRPLLGSS